MFKKLISQVEPQLNSTSRENIWGSKSNLLYLSRRSELSAALSKHTDAWATALKTLIQ